LIPNMTFFDWLFRYRWWVIFLNLSIVIAVASGGRYLTFSNDYRVFFRDDNPQLIAFEVLQNIYSKNDNVLIVLALLLISGILMLVFRRLWLGTISMLPNLMPLVMTFGIWGLLFGEIGFTIAVVAPVALGIIVDDTVHFLINYLRARRDKGKNAKEAVRDAFQMVGAELWMTSLVLVAGFLVLSLSGLRRLY